MVRKIFGLVYGISCGISPLFLFVLSIAFPATFGLAYKPTIATDMRIMTLVDSWASSHRMVP